MAGKAISYGHQAAAGEHRHCAGGKFNDLQFGDEIRFAVSILRFVNIGSDTGSGSADLIGDDRFVLTFQKLYQIEYLHGKINGKCTQFAFSHNQKFLLVFYVQEK